MSAPPSPPGVTRPPALGIAHWVRFGAYEETEALVRDLSRMGITHLRAGVSWADYVREGGKDWYDWLLPTLGRHFDLLLCASYTPPSIGIVPSTAAPPRDPKAYADFLDELVARHGLWFRHIELWNEPNNLLDWDWRHDPAWETFARMIGGAAYWMRRLGRVTVLGGMCPTDTNWLWLMGQRGVLEHIDVVGVHGFPDTWSADFPGWASEIDCVRRTLDGFDWNGSIWITECGYSTWRRDDGKQIEHLLAAQAAPTERVYWYSYRDLDPALPSQEGFHFDERHYHTGLFTSDGRPKLAGRLLAQGGVPALREFCGTLGAPYLKPVRDRVLVTGGCGFVGSNLADRLADRGDDVLVVDNFARPGAEENADWLKSRHRTRLSIEFADMRDRHALESLVADASAVLHLAAQVAVTTSLQHPREDFETNAAGTLNLLEAIRQRKPEAPLVFASTNKVYGRLFAADEIAEADDRYAPADRRFDRGINESSPLDFYSPYGCSKGVADQYVHDYARVFGLRTVVLRMSCIYGDRQFGTEDQGWLAHFMIRAIRGQPITIYGDGRQVRDVLYVDDAVAAWLLALDRIDRTAGGVFNLGGGPKNAISLLQALDLIGERRGFRPTVQFQQQRPGDQLWYVSNTAALQAATEWRPRTKLPEGMRRLERWLERRFTTTSGATESFQEASA